MMEQEAGVPVPAGADGVQLPSQIIAELIFGAQTELQIDLLWSPSVYLLAFLEESFSGFLDFSTRVVACCSCGVYRAATV